MAKQRISEDQQKRFDKQQFKIGDAVFFTWLGSKKYGYVTSFKKVNWGIQYTVRSENTSYPCGIEIKGAKTNYNTGCIHYEATRAIDSDELIRRAEIGYDRIDSELLIYSRRTEVQSRSNSAVSESVSIQDSKGNESSKVRTSRKNASTSSTNGVRKTNPRQRKDIELESAIDRQKNFLNGFIKKD